MNQPGAGDRPYKQIIKIKPMKKYKPSIEQMLREGLEQQEKPVIRNWQEGYEYKQAFSAEECAKLFGERDAVRMNYIPQMVTALMLDQATKLANYAWRNKVSETKPNMRMIRRAVEGYTDALKKAYGEDAYSSYCHYAARFGQEMETTMWLVELQAHELRLNQLPNVKHGEIAERALIIHMLITFCQHHDNQVDEEIENRTGRKTNAVKDAFRYAIWAACIDIAKKGWRIDADEKMATWVKVIANKAYLSVDKIFDEEKAKMEQK